MMGSLMELIHRMRAPGAGAGYAKPPPLSVERRRELDEAAALLAARPPLADERRTQIEAGITMALADVKRFGLLGIVKSKVMEYWRRGHSIDVLLDRAWEKAERL